MFGRKKVVVIPSTDNSEKTYARLYEILQSPELRDYLRVKIAECASGISDFIERNGAKSDCVSFIAGQIKALEYLIDQAPVEVERKLTHAKREKEAPAIMAAYRSRLAEDQTGE